MNRVIHFEIQADDVDRAINFYEKVFGWEIKPLMTKEQSGMDYWGVTTGDTGPGINGGMYQRPKKGTKQYLYDCTVEVPDIDKTVDMVKENGGKILREKTEIPGVGFFASAKDTEGNKIGLMQPTDWKLK